MTKQNSKIPVLIMALIMAAIGLAVPYCLLTLFTDHTEPYPVPPTSTPTPTPTSLAPISVLLIGVDSFGAPQPNLESVTVVKYQTQVPNYFLFAVSPDTMVCSITGTSPARPLREFYADDLRDKHGEAVLTEAALAAISSELSPIYAEIDFDRHAIVETTHTLGPISCMGKTLTGEQWLRRFDALPAAAAVARLRFQGSLLQCIMLEAKKQNWDFPKLMNSLGQHFYPTRDRAEATLEAAPPLAQSDIAVNYIPLNPIVTPTPTP